MEWELVNIIVTLFNGVLCVVNSYLLYKNWRFYSHWIRLLVSIAIFLTAVVFLRVGEML